MSHKKIAQENDPQVNLLSIPWGTREFYYCQTWKDIARSKNYEREISYAQENSPLSNI